MNTYQIRFNKSRGQAGRGSMDHVWRVFENGKEFLFKNIDITTPIKSEKDANGIDYNITCQGYMAIDRDTSTAVITAREVKEIKPQRTCDSCTKCCQGTLTGSAYGHDFIPGKPCFFVGEKGCTIYADRPENPCVSFKCEWLAADYLPMWMRPDLSKVIAVRRQFDDGEWLELYESGQKMDSGVLSWVLIWAANNKKNVRYQVDGGWNWVKYAQP